MTPSAQVATADQLVAEGLPATATALYLRAQDAGLPGLVAVASITGDESDLRDHPGWGGLPPELAAAMLVEAGRLADAHAILASSTGIRARYTDGVALAGLDRHDDAAHTFLDVLREVEARRGVRVTRTRAAELDHDRDLALLGIARVSYAAGDYEAALAWYDRVPRKSPMWPVAQREAAWAEFVLDHDERALARMVEAGVWSEPAAAPVDPEAAHLAQLLHFYRDDPRVLPRRPPPPVADNRAVETIALAVAQDLAARLGVLDILLKGPPSGLLHATLPAGARERADADARVRGLRRHLELLADERTRIQDPELGAIADVERARVEAKLATGMAEVLRRVAEEWKDWRTQNEIMRFELVTDY